MLNLQFLTIASSVLASTNTSYFQPNSTGIKLQNGFERVYIQVSTCTCGFLYNNNEILQPFGNHGIRVRASLLRDPTGTELSAFLDPPIEGPGGNQGLAHDTTLPFRGSASLRNGNIIANVTNGMLSFLRVEPNGSSTLLTSEYADTKILPSRFYTQDFRASTFAAQFSFSSTPDEQFYGTGQQACCNDNSVNKKGQVVDLINYNSHVTLPVYMSNKVTFVRLNHNSLIYPSVGISSVFQYAWSRENWYVYPPISTCLLVSAQAPGGRVQPAPHAFWGKRSFSRWLLYVCGRGPYPHRKY